MKNRKIETLGKRKKWKLEKFNFPKKKTKLLKTREIKFSNNCKIAKSKNVENRKIGAKKKIRTPDIQISQQNEINKKHEKSKFPKMANSRNPKKRKIAKSENKQSRNQKDMKYKNRDITAPRPQISMLETDAHASAGDIAKKEYHQH